MMTIRHRELSVTAMTIWMMNTIVTGFMSDIVILIHLESCRCIALGMEKDTRISHGDQRSDRR